MSVGSILLIISTNFSFTNCLLISSCALKDKFCLFF